MQALSQRKHQALVAALQQLTALVHKDVPAQGMDENIQSLCNTYRRYEALLDELAVCIDEYEKLHHHVKVNVLGKTLKALKKEISAEQPGYLSLQENIRNAYGT